MIVLEAFGIAYARRHLISYDSAILLIYWRLGTVYHAAIQHFLATLKTRKHSADITSMEALRINLSNLLHRIHIWLYLSALLRLHLRWKDVGLTFLLQLHHAGALLIIIPHILHSRLIMIDKGWLQVHADANVFLLNHLLLLWWWLHLTALPL